MFKRIIPFFFRNKSTSQTVAKNTFWLLTGQGAQIFRIILIIYAARVLGAAGLGLFSYAVTLAGMFTTFSDIGISAVLNREASRNPETRASYISTSFFLKLLLILASIGIIYLALPLYTNVQGIRPLLIVICLILTFDSMIQFGYALIRAAEKMEQEAIIHILTNVSILTLGLVFLWKFNTPTSLTWAYALGSGIGLLTTLFIIKSELKSIIKSFSKSLVWKIFSSAWPFALVTLLSTLMINIDTLVIGHFRSITDIGLYTAAQRPIQLFYTSAGLIASAVFPVFARLAKKDDVKFRAIFEKMLTATFLIAIPLAVGGVILGKEVILILFGNQYLGATLTFQLLMLTMLTTFPSSIFINGVFAYDRQKVFTWFISLGVIINFVLDVIFIPRWGIAGSAVATIIAQLVIWTLLLTTIKRLNNFSVWPSLLKITTASLVMALLIEKLSSANISFYLTLPLGVAVYFTSLIILREPFMEDLKRLTSIQP